MKAPHKHPGLRLSRLERLARERPCPGCGRISASGPPAEEPDWQLLGAAERAELAGLVAAGSTPPCPRCGRAGHDLTRLTDDQLDRTLRLLRKLYGRNFRCWWVSSPPPARSPSAQSVLYDKHSINGEHSEP